MDKIKKAFKDAFPVTIPICASFLFLGMSYGFLMTSKGFSPWYPFFMSMLIFAGSMEFVTITLLLSAFNPLAAFLLAIVVNARHLFYGLSLLDKYKGTGKLKPYLIFGLCDETFAINSSVEVAEDEKKWFYFFTTLLNQIYWVTGSTLGAVAGNYIAINTEGLDFVLTALFVTIFLNQWKECRNHIPAIIGIAITLAALFVLGPDDFLLPAMALILIILTVIRRRIEE